MAVSLKMKAKVLARSRSLAFLRDCLAPYDGGRMGSIAGDGMQLHYRVGSSDPWMIYNHLMKPRHRDEYAPPRDADLAPAGIRTVLDIGANVGVTALYFADLFPDGNIYAFEPVPDNFAVLQKNIANCPRIRGLNYGLGAADGELEMFASANPVNFGGFSLHPAGSDASRRVRIQVRNAAGALRELGITQVDVIKIDTEGAEYDILTALPGEILAGAQYVVGELHGNRDFALLGYLSRWFDVGLRKRLGSRLFNFQALPKRRRSSR